MSDDFRTLHADDLDDVVTLDARISGRPRHGFFEKRLAAAMATPKSFLTVAREDGGKVVAYAFARIQEGDFGDPRKVAVLDAVGVDPDHQGKGLGKGLMAALEDKMRHYKISVMRTQAAWSDTAMVNYFKSTGFRLSPRLIVERPADGGIDF